MMLLPQDGYKAAIYCRLSRDEDAGQESNSIGNQRRMLTEYAEKNGYPIVNEYVDAADIIGLNQKPEANGRRFSPFSLVSAHFKANGGCNCLI
jgi:hypothetical protein